MIEALIALFGVVIGFLLNEGATRIRQDHEERRRARSVRVILAAEIDQNLWLLGNFWDQVLATPVTDPEQRSKRLALKFISLPFPNWNRDALKADLSHMPAALSNTEIVATLRFYGQLVRLASLRDDLKEAASGIEKSGSVPRPVFFPDAIYFTEKVPGYWAECEGIVSQLMTTGNPLTIGDEQ